jgi:hypothetical protein
MGTELSDVKFAVSAFDSQFSEHTISDCIGLFAVFLLGHEFVVICPALPGTCGE